MHDRYDPSDEFEAHYPGLEELLTEYVDGTMEPELQEAFEEFLDANPGLAERVRRLEHTRSMLCGLGCRCTAPPGFHFRLRCRLACEMIQTDPLRLFTGEADRPRFFTVAALTLMMLLMGSGVYRFVLSPFTVESAVTLLPPTEQYGDPIPGVNRMYTPVQAPAPLEMPYYHASLKRSAGPAVSLEWYLPASADRQPARSSIDTLRPARVVLVGSTPLETDF